MSADSRHEILVVGGGPAGLAAAWAAARTGARAAIVDENPAWGGQIWRGEQDHPHSSAASEWFRKAAEAKVHFLDSTRVFTQPEPGVLWAEMAESVRRLPYDRLILCTGARELFLPFPGWTLPNVMGAGGLQALVKSGMDIEGKRVVVAGSGPLLLAVAAYLRKHGARIAVIAEQAAWPQLCRFGFGLTRHPGKLAQTVMLKWSLRGVPYRLGCWPTCARGHDRLESVTLSDGKRSWDERCDFLACGFGLVPNTELAQLLGCTLDRGTVWVDEWQQTSAARISCAGEATGIGGLERSLIEGQIAGLAAAGRAGEARKLFAARARAHGFARALQRAFALREELKTLAQADTIVCRCEDVSLSQLAPYTSWRSAKLHTRMGMGPCQGRICGPAVGFLCGWQPESVRPPVVPVCMGSFLSRDAAQA